MSQNANIVFLGTPEFALPALKQLIENDLRPELVITQPDRPVGRGYQLAFPPVKQLALDNNLAIEQPKTRSELSNIFSSHQFDIAVLVAYGMIIPSAILAAPRCGFLNLHPSLLPKYRGSSPIQASLLNGDRITGITIMRLSDKMDAGPIISQQIVDVLPGENAHSLSRRLAEIGAMAMIDSVKACLANNVAEVTQDEAQATYTTKVSRSDGRVDWTRSARDIERQFSAFTPWPGLYTFLDGKRLKIEKIGVIEGYQEPVVPGSIIDYGDNLTVQTSDGIIELQSVTPEGKKNMTGREFRLGQGQLIGKKLT